MQEEISCVPVGAGKRESKRESKLESTRNGLPVELPQPLRKLFGFFGTHLEHLG